MNAIRISVSGLVQGVFFRKATKQQADELGITGWVRNTEDGNVEIHAEGSPDVLEQFQAWCRKGPSAAEVDHIEVQDVPVEGFRSFVVQR
ncbi:MAG: acylphosphatase [Patescibacteria group bacterium]